MTEKNWVEIAKVGDVDDEEAIRVEVDGQPVALYYVEGNITPQMICAPMRMLASLKVILMEQPLNVLCIKAYFA